MRRLQEVRSILLRGQLHLGRCLTTLAFANSASSLAAKAAKQDNIILAIYAKLLAFLVGLLIDIMGAWLGMGPFVRGFTTIDTACAAMNHNDAHDPLPYLQPCRPLRAFDHVRTSAWCHSN